MYSIAAERIFFRIISIVNRNIISIPEGCFGRIRFFLLYKYDAIQFAEVFKLAAKLTVWDADKVLIVLFADTAATLECFIITSYKCTYIVCNAVIYDPAGSFVHVIIDLVVTVSCNRFLPVRRLFTVVLFVLYRLQTSVFLVKPLIDGFEFSSVYDERPAIAKKLRLQDY